MFEDRRCSRWATGDRDDRLVWQLQSELPSFTSLWYLLQIHLRCTAATDGLVQMAWKRVLRGLHDREAFGRRDRRLQARTVQ